LGRSFVLGRVNPRGEVYAGVDALALGSVPDDPEALPVSLRAGHTAIHAWYRASVFGRSISNGCIRMPKKGQQDLLKNIDIGTVVTVIE
jgi:lipoprotein-anchoring transpeptidase ErfK/SrfK